MSSVTSDGRACAEHRWHAPERYDTAADVRDRDRDRGRVLRHREDRRDRLTESYPLCANFPFMEVRPGSMGRPT